MMKRGYKIDLRRLRRLLGEMKLYCRRRQRTAHNTEPPKQKYYRNKIKGCFTVSAPNKVWVSDTTYLFVNNEPYFLTTIIDLYSRKVIGYDVVDSIAAFPLIKIFKQTFEERGKPEGLIFHSDQGSQFTAYRFRVLLRGCGVMQSFSAPSNPYDNAVAESFFKNVKAECIYVNVFKKISTMKKTIDRYIYKYNEIRPHEFLSNLTPNEFENAYSQSV